MLNDDILYNYYKLTNNTIFLQNMTSVELDSVRLYTLARDDYDVRQKLDNIDEGFIKAVDDLAQYLDTFNRSVSIDSVFLSKNILQLVIFYRKLSYEHVSQQKAYDIFALICDIGGSLGLFI